MEIKVERTEHSGGLTFTINVTEPHDAPFTEIDYETLNFLEKCKHSVENLASPEYKLVDDVVNAIHNIEQNVFNRIKGNLEFAITYSLKEKFAPICQEIYNWIYDNQRPALKRWMQQFDPQRSKYYFDNDRTIESDDEDEE